MSWLGKMMGSPKPGDPPSKVVGASPKTNGVPGIFRQCADVKNVGVTAEVDVEELFGPPTTTSGQPTQEQSAPPTVPPAPAATGGSSFIWAVTGPSKPAGPPTDSAEFPQWLLSKVDEYITEHFYQLEAKLTKLEQKMCDLASRSQESKNEEVLQQMKMLIELQFAEAQKGVARDAERRVMSEQFDGLVKEVRITSADAILNLRADLESLHHDLEGYGLTIKQEVQESMRKRDDATYRFEADLMAIKKSFSSLRLEFNKNKKGQDFKNCSTSVFLVKAMDMKKEQRSEILRTLSEQEDKFRGAVTKAEGDLRDHEKEMHGMQTV